jgi:hypothetical protein
MIIVTTTFVGLVSLFLSLSQLKKYAVPTGGQAR